MIFFTKNIDLIHLLDPIKKELRFLYSYYFSLTRSREPEPKLHILAPALAKNFGSLRLQLHNIEN
jgi:hypothetical protein